MGNMKIAGAIFSFANAIFSELLALLEEQSIPIFCAVPFEFCIRNAFGLVQKLIRDESLKIHGYFFI